MKTLLLFTVLVSGIAGFTACGDGSANIGDPGSPGVPKKTMRAFRSDQELSAWFRLVAEKYKREQRRRQAEAKGYGTGTGTGTNSGQGVMNASSAYPALKTSADEPESVTNAQHAGVDEGGIVKIHGDHLVVLRRGRLFTIAIGDGALKPISTVDAFGPDIDPRHAWYDEMLVSDDTIAVIGYSYERGGTEVGLFNIDKQGSLSYRSTHHLRSNDYYSSRNYASRLIGNKLIFYTPLHLNPAAEDPFQSLPAVRKWRKGAGKDDFQRIASPTRIYRAERPLNGFGLALHTVTVCDLSNGGFTCEATGVIGPAGRVFYVSPQAVYVWVTDWVSRGETTRAQSMLYRMPLDGSAPSALAVTGSPIDQFSFLETSDNNLNVVVRSQGAGDGMWNAEKTEGAVALLRVPIDSFSDGSEAASLSSYRKLPKPAGYTFQNRFVGDYVLYGSGSGWGNPEPNQKPVLFAVRLADAAVSRLALVHGVDRIEPLGTDAVVVGTDGQNLHFSSVRLAESPEVTDRFTRQDASQGELRSHGFFYKPDGDDSGTLGLPISTAGRPGYKHLVEGSASILFLRNSFLHFEEIGELAAQPEKATDDGCRASCVDWYGNARPLFVRGRIFALLGYEIVEGSLAKSGIHELRRINYSPARPATRPAD